MRRESTSIMNATSTKPRHVATYVCERPAAGVAVCAMGPLHDGGLCDVCASLNGATFPLRSIEVARWLHALRRARRGRRYRGRRRRGRRQAWRECSADGAEHCHRNAAGRVGTTRGPRMEAAAHGGTLRGRSTTGKTLSVGRSIRSLGAESRAVRTVMSVTDASCARQLLFRL